MGRDKALLSIGGTTLLEQVAERVREAAGDVTVIAEPEQYANLGLRIEHDLVDDSGPMGGIYTALQISSASWNLIVACDMPRITVGLLNDLFEAAETAAAPVLVPESASGLHPLCAIYHRQTLAAVEQCINSRVLKMHDLLHHVGAVSWPVPDETLMENVNTIFEWGSR
jgi:molybdenum cofactor guanylyltransferase